MKEISSARFGCRQVAAELIGGSVDVGEPLVGQGLDSLASMELRQKLQVSGKGLTGSQHCSIHGQAQRQRLPTLLLVASG